MRNRLKDMLRFRPEKGPGFGLSKTFYLSVLAPTATLPPILAIVTPKGDQGTVPGFGVPLGDDAKRSDLAMPMTHGAYAIASPNQKTVLQLLVMAREAAGFDPSTFLNSRVGQDLPDEVRHRIAAMWHLLQLTIVSYDPAVYPAAEFLLKVADRLARETEGVVADPISQVYTLPGEVLHEPPAGMPIVASDYVKVKHRPSREGLLHVTTLGLQKFVLPEIEIEGVDESDLAIASLLLQSLAQTVLTVDRLGVGDRIGPDEAPLRVAEGGLDRAFWNGIPAFELIPDRTTVSQSLRAWTRETGKRA